MENCYEDRRCLICRRTTPKNLPKVSETPDSNASLLQDFLNCFHINVLHSEVHDLSTLCQFCPTCEQFISEWSNIQTQMTQLTRRAAQLEATLSALLLSAPQIHEQNRDVTVIINNRIQNSQEIQLPLLLHQTVDDIRNELQKKYSVSVMLDKITLPHVQRLDPLSANYDNADETWDRWEFGADDSDEEYLTSEDPLDDKVTRRQLLEMNIKSKEEGNCDDSQDSTYSKEMNVKARNIQTNGSPKRKRKRYAREAIIIPVGPNKFKYKGMSFKRNEEDQTYSCDVCGFKSGPTILSIRNHLVHHLTKKDLTARNEKQPVMIPDGPNKFKYNGYDISFNDQDQCYDCGHCNYERYTTVQSILAHIRMSHYTTEDKIKFTAVRKSNTEWLYGGKFKIIKMEEKKFICVSCGTMKTRHDKMVAHIRSKHVDLEGPDTVIPLPKKDTPCFNDSTEPSDHVMADKIQVRPVLKVDPLPTDSPTVDEAWDLWECEANIQLPVVPKIEPFAAGDNNNDEPWDHEDFEADDSDEEYLPKEDEVNDVVTECLEIRNKAKEEANCDYSHLQDFVDSNETKNKTGNIQVNECSSKSISYSCDFIGREDKLKFTAVKISNTEWLYGGKYKIIKVDGNKLKCVSCGSIKSNMRNLVFHIRTHQC